MNDINLLMIILILLISLYFHLLLLSFTFSCPLLCTLLSQYILPSSFTCHHHFAFSLFSLFTFSIYLRTLFSFYTFSPYFCLHLLITSVDFTFSAQLLGQLANFPFFLCILSILFQFPTLPFLLHSSFSLFHFHSFSPEFNNFLSIILILHSLSSFSVLFSPRLYHILSL